MWKGMFNWRKESMLSFPQHRRLLMTGMLFSYVEWQKKSQGPLLLFRVSKTVLIKKIAILGDTPLRKTTHGKLISHLCHNRWCLLYDVERGAATFMNKESCRVWRWRHCFIHQKTLLAHLLEMEHAMKIDVKYIKVSIHKSLVLSGRSWGSA